jgi:hypothetical protein
MKRRASRQSGTRRAIWPPDILVNNAGTTVRKQPEDLTAGMAPGDEQQSHRRFSVLATYTSGDIAIQRL